MCTISSWGLDGFGHQLMSTVRCKEYALQNDFAFVGTKKTRMEHTDPDKPMLLEVLTNISGSERYDVTPRRHGACDKGCDSFAVCGDCLSKPDLQIRRRVARALCANVPPHRVVPCEARYACFHLRQTQSWEQDRWLSDRRPDLRRLNRSRASHKAVITHGHFDDPAFFKADYCIFSTIAFVHRCCRSYESLSRSHFADALRLVHEHCPRRLDSS